MPSETFHRIKSLTKHLLLTVGLGVFIVLVFFYIYLPSSTNHGETITVPDVENQPFDQLDNILVGRRLRYEVNADSGYSASQAPLTVLDQFPKANSKVKENRRIYVTLNARRPPLVRLPEIVGKSLMIAQAKLEAYGLKVGQPSYENAIGVNNVLRASSNGKELLNGQMIPKGSEIDLVLSNGGKSSLKMPRLLEEDEEIARVLILGNGLKIGTVVYVPTPTAVIQAVNQEGDTVDAVVNVSLGEVVKQRPEAGATVRLQNIVDLWVYRTDTVPTQNAETMYNEEQ